jgi:hypothetical protein
MQRPIQQATVRYVYLSIVDWKKFPQQDKQKIAQEFQRVTGKDPASIKAGAVAYLSFPSIKGNGKKGSPWWQTWSAPPPAPPAPPPID